MIKELIEDIENTRFRKTFFVSMWESGWHPSYRPEDGSVCGWYKDASPGYELALEGEVLKDTRERYYRYMDFLESVRGDGS